MLRKCLALCLTLSLCALTLATAAAGEVVDLGAMSVTAPAAGMPIGEAYALMGAVVGDAFYAITETSLGLRLDRAALRGDQTETLTRDGVLGELDGLFVYEGSLYGIRVKDDSWLRLLDERGAFAPERQTVELDLSGLRDGGGEAIQPSALFAQDDHLYYIAREDFSPRSIGGRVSLADGRKQAFPIENLSQMAPYEHGKVIVYQSDPQAAGAQEGADIGRCAVFDADANAFGDAWHIRADGTPEASVQGLCYGDGNAYYKLGSRVMGLDMSTGESRVSAYTGEGMLGGGISAVYSGGDYVAYDLDGVRLYPLDSPSMLNGALRICGESGSSAHRSFLKKYPGIPVDIVEGATNSIDGITQAMLTDADPYDILLLSLTHMPVESLISKGYAADLSGDAELLRILEHMYPEYAGALRKDGGLYGVPVNVRMSAMSVDMELWDSLGLAEDELPATFPELLDFVANWAYDYADEYADIDLFDMGQPSSALFTQMLNAYIVHMQERGLELRFDTPELRALLDAFSYVDFDEIDSLRDQREFFSFDNRALFSFGDSVAPAGYGRAAKTPLYLAIAQGEAPVVAANLTVMIVNPRTPRMDTALLYMKNYLNNLPATGANITLYADHNDAVEMPGYRRAMDDAAAVLADAQRRLDAASAEYKAEIQESIRMAQSDMEYLEQNRFDVTAEDIERYRRDVLPKVYVQRQNPLTSGDKQSLAEINSIINQYLGGAITMDRMIQELDNRLRLMMLERM